MLCDYHLHSDFSYDGSLSVESIASGMAKMGFAEICLTDHLENYGEPRLFDCAGRREAIALCKAPLKITHGAEVTLHRQPPRIAPILDFLEKARLDFIIGSAHDVGGLDPYYPEYFSHRDRLAAVRDYLEEIATAIKLYDFFDVVGHFDYPQKFMRFEDSLTRYCDSPDAFDEIFRHLAQKGLGIELNTASYRSLASPENDPAILRRYKELGGEIVTVGSDAHRLEYLGSGIPFALQALQAAGFGYVCTYENRKPCFHKIG